jgi:aryl-alcohol dehydrogenase-like predicted oxidoreductase
MNYVELGPVDTRVSRLCLGTVNFGLHVSEDDAFLMLDKALEHGINFIDTADVYGNGQAEYMLGRWLAVDRLRRSRIVLATKVFGETSGRRLSRHYILQACEESLRRLKTDYIDLYQIHHVYRACPWEEIWEALEHLVRHGKVLNVGSSNFAAWDIACANGLAQQRRFVGFISEQSVYNLRRRLIELEVIPCCRAFRMAFLAYSPLGGGLLCGGLNSPAFGRRADQWLQNVVEQHRAQLVTYERLCDEVGHRPADVALAWVVRNPAVTAAIIGPRTVEQMEQNIGALDIALDDDIITKIDKIWPGPGGEAPEAYAW